MPHGFTAKIAPEFTDKITTKKLYWSNSILTGKKLKGNDKMIPVIQGINIDYTGCLMAIYKLDSDIKGTIIAGTINWTGLAAVDEDTQSRYLPRTILISLKYGVKKICWYEFLAMENKDDDQEHHFGITHKDLSPKPAFHAYATLAKMRPAGSSVPKITITPKGIYLATWEKKSDCTGWGMWVPSIDTKTKINGKLNEARDYLGNPVSIPVKEGMAEVKISSGIIYLDGPESIIME